MKTLVTVDDNGDDVYTEVNILFSEFVEDDRYCLIEGIKAELDATGCSLHQAKYYPAHFANLVSVLKEHIKLGYEIGIVLEEELI